MKNNCIRAFILFFLLAVFLVSCKNPFVELSEKKKNAVKDETCSLVVTVQIPTSADASVSSGARTVLPLALDSRDLVYDLTLGNSTNTLTLTNKRYNELSMSGMTPGQWSLAVTAKLPSTGVVVFSMADITPRDIVVGLNSIVLTLEPLDSGNGDVSVTVRWPDEEGITAGKVFLSDTVMAPTQAYLDSLPDTSLGTTGGFTFVTATQTLSAGTHYLYIQLRKNGTPVAVIRELVRIYGNRTSSKTITLTHAEISNPPPNPPSGVWLYVATAGYVRVSWIDNTNTETFFKIYRNGSLLTSNPSPDTFYEIDEIDIGDVITVSACNDFGETSTSTPVIWTGFSMQMELVPAGKFERDGAGTNSSYVSSFYMGKYEVTQTQYLAVMGNNPSYFTSVVNGPVERINWYDALVFCNKLSMLEGFTPVYVINGTKDPAGWGSIPSAVNTTWDAVIMSSDANGYRLPTDDEWTWAALGASSTFNADTRNFAGHTSDTQNINDYSWTASNSDGSTHQVGTKLPNTNIRRLHDMTGNVNEFCWNWQVSPATYPSGLLDNYTGLQTGEKKIGKGAAYFGGAVSLADHSGYDYWLRLQNYGFRVVRNAEPSYSIVYAGNGNTRGSVPPVGRYSQNGTAELSGNTGDLFKTGYTFAGWSANTNGSGTAYVAGDTISMGVDNITLYARWAAMAEDGENLPIGALNGHGGWSTVAYPTFGGAPDIIVSPGTGINDTNIFSYDKGSNGAGVDANYPLSQDIDMSLPIVAYRLQFDVTKSALGVTVGFATSLGSTAFISKDDMTKFALLFHIQDADDFPDGPGIHITLPGGNMNSYPDISPDAWVRIEMVMINESFTLNYKILPDGVWNTIFSGQAIGTSSFPPGFYGIYNPRNWDVLYVHMEGNGCMLDNISFEKIE